MAKIIILGNLTADAELKSTVKNDRTVEFVTFSVAENERRGDENIARNEFAAGREVLATGTEKM